jgi:hypothetical protein
MRRASWVVIVTFAALGCSSSSSSSSPSDSTVAETSPDSAGADTSSDSAGADTSTTTPCAPPTTPIDPPTDAGVCAWANDPHDCWGAMVASIDACLGVPCDPPEDRGVLAPDGRTCNYASGRHVDFEPYVDATTNPTDVTVTLGGVVCFHYQGTPSKTTIGGPIGSMVVDLTGPGSATVTCPDGTSFALSQSDIDACPSGVFPGFEKSVSGPPLHISWTLHGASAPLFDCASP